MINYLGLKIDNNLTWDEHVNSIKSKISSVNFAIYRIRNILPPKQLWMIYHAHIISHINYQSPIWIGCAEYKLKEIQRIQNRTIKTIERKHRLTSTETLYTNRPNVKSIAYINTVVTIQKIKMNKIKNNVTLNTVGNNERQTALRNQRNYRPIFSRTEKAKNSMQIRGIKWYNMLDNDIKNEENIVRFKKKTLEYILSNCNRIT